MSYSSLLTHPIAVGMHEDSPTPWMEDAGLVGWLREGADEVEAWHGLPRSSTSPLRDASVQKGALRAPVVANGYLASPEWQSGWRGVCTNWHRLRKNDPHRLVVGSDDPSAFVAVVPVACSSLQEAHLRASSFDWPVFVSFGLCLVLPYLVLSLSWYLYESYLSLYFGHAVLSFLSQTDNIKKTKQGPDWRPPPHQVQDKNTTTQPTR
jgi:hypothetical protein